MITTKNVINHPSPRAIYTYNLLFETTSWIMCYVSIVARVWEKFLLLLWLYIINTLHQV